RMALSHLVDAQAPTQSFKARFLHVQLQAIERMLERRFRTPLTSSAGRLFDAVASLAGVADRVGFEGQAAIQLEGLASRVAPAGVYPLTIEPGQDEGSAESLLLSDTRPLIATIAEEAAHKVDPAIIARRFHSTLVDGIAQVCNRVRDTTALGAVVLRGGVFLNALLTSEVSCRLRKD